MKLVIDTDPGIDDAMAILYAALATDIDLIGLTTVFGNVPVGKATRNALRLAELAGLDIPVAEGAAGPLSGRATSPVEFIHGTEGFGHIPAAEPKGRVIGPGAADLLCQLARTHRQELVVCAIGPITNLALAIRQDPDFATNVARIVFMGGAYGVPGNVTPHAEANTWNDPEALNIVLRSGARIVMVGLDVTMKTLCDAEYFARLAAANPRLGGFLEEASRLYLDFYESTVGTRGCSLHDPAAVIACTHLHLFDMRPLPVVVRDQGAEVGRTAPGQDPRDPVISVCVDGDMEAVKRRFAAVFGVQ